MIEVKNLEKVYGVNKAVDSLNFTVDKGQLFVCDVIERMDGKCDKIK